MNPQGFPFFQLLINPTWKIIQSHLPKNPSSHIFHISIDRHSRHLYLEDVKKDQRRAIPRLPQEPLENSKRRDDKQAFL